MRVETMEEEEGQKEGECSEGDERGEEEDWEEDGRWAGRDSAPKPKIGRGKEKTYKRRGSW